MIVKFSSYTYDSQRIYPNGFSFGSNTNKPTRETQPDKKNPSNLPDRNKPLHPTPYRGYEEYDYPRPPKRNQHGRSFINGLLTGMGRTMGTIGSIAFATYLLANVFPEEFEILKDRFGPTEPPFTVEEMHDNAEEALAIEDKFDQVNLVNAITNVLDDKKVPQDMLNYYLEELQSPDYNIYLNKETAQGAILLILASDKGLVDPNEISEGLKKVLKYDSMSGYVYTSEGNYPIPGKIGDGEARFYVAARIFERLFPNQVKYMSDTESAERGEINKKGIFDFTYSKRYLPEGTTKDGKLYLGNMIDGRDAYYSDVLRNSYASTFDPNSFGYGAIGYAISGKLNNLDGMTLDEVYTLYVKSKEPENKSRLKTDEDYKAKVFSAEIVYNMREAVLYRNDLIPAAIAHFYNDDEMAAGLATIALQEAGFLDKHFAIRIVQQLEEEASGDRLLLNETKKVNIALKALALAQEGYYSNLPVATRVNIRKFQANHPSTKATAMFRLAESTYLRDVREMMAEYEKLQTNLSDELQKEVGEKDPQLISDSILTMKNNSEQILKIASYEIEVAEQTNDQISLEYWGNIQTGLSEQGDQLQDINNRLEGNENENPTETQPQNTSDDSTLYPAAE